MIDPQLKIHIKKSIAEKNKNVVEERKLNEFEPRPYQVPILAALQNGFKRVLAIMPRRCLSKSTHITMHDGSYKPLGEIKVGDTILSWNGSKFVPDRVVSVWETWKKRAQKTRSGNFLPITTSKDHVFAHTCGYGVSFDSIGLIGKFRSLLQYSGVSSAKNHNPDLCRFWGYMLADGYASGFKQPKFTNSSEEILNHVEKLAATLFDIRVTRKKKGNGFELGISNKTLGGGCTKNPVKELFRKEGLDVPKRKRRLPSSMWGYDEESILAFFASLISTNGSIYVQKNGWTPFGKIKQIPPSCEITLSCGFCEEYAWDIYWLLRKIGIVPQAPFFERETNWKVRLTKSSGIKKILKFPIFGKRSAQKLALEKVFPFTKKSKITNGCFHSRFKTQNSDPEAMVDIETKRNHNFVANGYVVHNSGKDITALNHMISQMWEIPGVYYYIFPTYSQAKKVIWDSMTNEGRRILDYFPEELILQKNSQEMKIRMEAKDGQESLFQLVGSDNVNSLVGTNPRGCVFSEYALQDPIAYQYLQPILTANGGWALFLSTPRGKNHLWSLAQLAEKSPDWFYMKLTVEDTRHIPIEEIERERREGLMSEDLIQQEYYCSFTMGIEGSIYSHYLDMMRLERRIGECPVEAGFPVHTSWDIGRDVTSIIFFQTIGQTIRIIDCYEKDRQNLQHFASLLESKKYFYGKHFFPHDMRVREWAGSNYTRLEKARQLGINGEVVDNISIEDGIELTRNALSKIWINEPKCRPLIDALENYRREYDSRRRVYKLNPLHDRHSHFMDALRYLVLSLPKTRDGLSKEDLEARYQKAMHGSQGNLPPIFRTNSWDYI